MDAKKITTEDYEFRAALRVYVYDPEEGDGLVHDILPYQALVGENLEDMVSNAIAHCNAWSDLAEAFKADEPIDMMGDGKIIGASVYGAMNTPVMGEKMFVCISIVGLAKEV